MKTIFVDDEIWMLERLAMECESFEEIDIVGKYSSSRKALEYAVNNDVELAFLDIEMPEINGLELAEKLKRIHPDIVIIYVSAYSEHMPDAFRSFTADYFVIKPYRKADIRVAVEKAKLLSAKQNKKIFIRTFGRFSIFIDGKPVRITGKAKEILALLVTQRGKEVSNSEIYHIMWEDRDSDNNSMKVYYNALKRLKETLEENHIRDLLLSTQRGQLVNTDIFDCDYYWWKDGKNNSEYEFEGEFLQEYSWGEYILAGMLREIDKY